MIRKNYMMTPRIVTALKKEADRLEVSVSELLRKIVDEYFCKGGAK